MPGVVGNFAGLARLRGAVHRLATPQWKAELAMGLGATALKLFQDGFKQSRDPYGRPWQKLVLRRGKPLLDTGRMAASASVRPAPNGFRLVVTAGYASTHQYGAKDIVPRTARMLSWTVRGSRRRYFAKRVTIPRRQMLPEQSTGGLGPIWTKALAAEAVERRNRLFREGR